MMTSRRPWPGFAVAGEEARGLLPPTWPAMLPFLGWTVLSCWMLTAKAAEPTESVEPVRPNIVLIMADDLGKEWVSAYGGEAVETPELDRMAELGMKFANAYSMPQCTPTRVTLLTGQYPFRHGWVNHWDVPRWGCGAHFDPDRNNSVGRVLREAGYATAAAGKWQIDDFRVEPDALEQAGFDAWAMWTGYESGNPASGKRYWDPYIHTREGSRTYKGEFGPDIFSDFLIDFMGRTDDRPMFIYYPMVLPHRPLVATPDEPDAEGKEAKQKAMVRYIDKLVGRIVDAVDQDDSERPTIVIFTTDNGSTRAVRAKIHGRDVRGGKARLDEVTGTSMPFLVYGPELVPQGVTVEALTDFTDLLPTFAELAGGTIPAGPGREVDGESIAPLLLGTTEEAPREWILSMGRRPAEVRQGRVVPRKPYASRAIRNHRWKIWVDADRQAHRLHDLKHDPFEEKNLLDSEDPEAVSAHKQLMGIVRSQPETDAAPRYAPNPPQPWDRESDWMEQLPNAPE